MTATSPSRGRHRPQASPCSSRTCIAGTARSTPSTGCRSTSPRASSSRCSGRRAAARRPRSGRSAGSTRSTQGRILVDGRDISHVPANKRNMGIVFQAYSLFPNMTARDNVGLRPAPARRTGRERARRPSEMLELVGLGAGRAATRISCPAGSSSGSRSPGRWPSSRACSCSTSRCRRSTPRSAASSARRSAGSRSRSASRRCSSPTTRRRRWRWATGSASCRPAASSRSRHRPSCTTARGPRFVAEFVGLTNRIPERPPPAS